MLKPRFGGGGKNISFLRNHEDLLDAVSRLKALKQSTSYFVEHAVDPSTCKHIEFQYMGDGHGHVECLGGRDCTPQVNHQKWLEYSLCLENRPDLKQLSQNLKTILSTLQYQSWGTVECLVEETGHVQLLEVNPRLQVEHGVTEMDRGLDLIEMAIYTSCYGKLPEPAMLPDTDQTLEFRLYARSCGRLEKFGLDKDIHMDNQTHFRMETAYSRGDEISGVYDGMLARFIIKHPLNRLDALKSILLNFQIEGIEHNLSDLYSMN